MYETEKILTEGCWYQFTSTDVRNVEYARDLLKTMSNITEITLVFDGTIDIISEDGEECKIQAKLMAVNESSCYLKVTDNKGSNYEFLTIY
jgi:hypothetical protein